MKISESDRKAIAHALAATWRAHSTSGVGPNAGAFEVYEDAEKLTTVGEAVEFIYEHTN